MSSEPTSFSGFSGAAPLRQVIGRDGEDKGQVHGMRICPKLPSGLMADTSLDHPFTFTEEEPSMESDWEQTG